MRNIAFELINRWLPLRRLKQRASLDSLTLRNRISLIDIGESDTVYCIGNGPSLRTQDLSGLNGKFCILTNRAYQLLDRFNPRGSVTVMTDINRIHEIVPALKLARPEESILFSVNSIDDKAVNCVKYLADDYFIMPKYVKHGNRIFPRLSVDLREGFSSDISDGVYIGYSVIFTAIQVAFVFGAKKIVCLGIDMNYVGDPLKDHLVPGVVNHFNFDYEQHGRKMFVLLRDELKSRGVVLQNATIGGKVDVLDRIAI